MDLFWVFISRDSLCRGRVTVAEAGVRRQVGVWAGGDSDLDRVWMGSGPGSVWGPTWAQFVEGHPSWKPEPSLASHPGAQKARVRAVE